MTDAIIGGAIAAVIGAVGYAIIALWLERRREKAQQLRIVDDLIIETSQNLIICKKLEKPGVWWTASFKLAAYDAYKGQLFFLPEDVRLKLADAALTMEDCTVLNEVLQQAAASGQNFDTEPIPAPKELVEHLEFVNEELQKWRKEHTR